MPGLTAEDNRALAGLLETGSRRLSTRGSSLAWLFYCQIQVYVVVGGESGSGSECTYTESLLFECKALRGSVVLLRSDVLKTCVH